MQYAICVKIRYNLTSVDAVPQTIHFRLIINRNHDNDDQHITRHVFIYIDD